MDGEKVSFNKKMFCDAVKNEAFNQMLFGELSQEKIIITDLDSECFLIFLNYIMNFKSALTFDEAVKAFKVAWKYQVEFAINSLIIILVTKCNTNFEIAELINYGVFFSCFKLLESFMIYQKSKLFGAAYWFLYNSKIVNNLTVDSVKYFKSKMHKSLSIMKIIYDWARLYLENDDVENMTVVDFLKKENLIDLFDVNIFSDSSELFDFYFNCNGHFFFTQDEIMSRLKSFNSPNRWITFSQGERFSEVFDADKIRFFFCTIKFGPVIFLDDVDVEKKFPDNIVFRLKIRYLEYDGNRNDLLLKSHPIFFDTDNLEKNKLQDNSYLFTMKFSSGRVYQDRLQSHKFELEWKIYKSSCLFFRKTFCEIKLFDDCVDDSYIRVFMDNFVPRNNFK